MAESFIVTKAPPLLSSCMEIIRNLHHVRPGLRPAPVAITSITTECFGLHEALAGVKDLEVKGFSSNAHSHKILRRIEAFFLGCGMTISMVEEHTMDLRTALDLAHGEAILPMDSDIRKMWKDDDMKEFLSQIREYRSGLTSLLDSINSDRRTEKAQDLPVPDDAATLQLLERSRLSFKPQPYSVRSSLRDSLMSFDPSPPYALDMYNYTEAFAHTYDDDVEEIQDVESDPQSINQPQLGGMQGTEDAVASLVSLFDIDHTYNSHGPHQAAETRTKKAYHAIAETSGNGPHESASERLDMSATADVVEGEMSYLLSGLSQSLESARVALGMMRPRGTAARRYNLVKR